MRTDRTSTRVSVRKRLPDLDSQSNNLKIQTLDPNGVLPLWGEFPPGKGKPPNFSTQDSQFVGIIILLRALGVSM